MSNQNNYSNRSSLCYLGKDVTVCLSSPVTISTCAVLDMNDVNMTQAYKIMEIVKLLISLDNVAYPEMLGKMLIINAPWFGGKLKCLCELIEWVTRSISNRNDLQRVLPLFLNSQFYPN